MLRMHFQQRMLEAFGMRTLISESTLLSVDRTCYYHIRDLRRIRWYFLLSVANKLL